jgi:chromosome segregation ATPase
MKKVILTISKYLGAVGVIAATAWGAYAKLDNIEDGVSDNYDKIEEVKQKQEGFNDDMRQIKDTLEKIDRQTVTNANGIYTNRILMKYEREHRDEYTREQLDDQLRQMEELMDKKKEPQTVFNLSDSEDVTVDGLGK